MKFIGLAPFMLMACLLTGCSTQILEELNETSIPRDCREPAKLFTSFMVRAKNVSWSEAKAAKDKASILTIQLAFENVTTWSVALSNSSNGILYSIEYSLSGENSSRYAPKETSGVTNEIHQPIKPGEAAEGKLIFDVPKADYILVIERKFSGKPVSAKREDHRSACKIPSHDFSAARPSKLGGISGVY